MTLYVTSDWHIGHANIIRLCDRPFRDVLHMYETIRDNMLEVLTPDDTLLNLGDVVMGDREKHLAWVAAMALPCKHVLMPGNHDEPWIGNPNDKRRAKYTPMYEEVFDGVYQLPILSITDDTKPKNDIGMHPVLAWANHFPYEGDSHDTPRYNDFRYPDEGTPIVHGHTHSHEKISRTAKGTLQIHVGVDAWDFRPVSIDTIRSLIETEGMTV